MVPSESSRRKDRRASFGVWAVAGAVSLVFLWILADLLYYGLSSLSWEFLTAAPRDAGRAGGIGPLVVSTLLILAVCLAVAVPLGLGCAAWLAEVAGRGSLGRWVRRCLDLLAAVPSIVFGLFGTVFFCQVLGLGFSILAGGLTLACMVLPILVRATEAGFRSVPPELRQGAAALGMGRFATLRHLLLPAALPGLVVGLVLGIGRALAETAALLFTSGYVTRMPSSLWDSGRALSVHIYDLTMNVPGGEANAYGTALVLLLLLVGIHSLASWTAEAWLGRGWSAR
jgi:phosphate transport system permease protein